MFPITDSIKAERFPFLNYLLVAITVYVFIQQLTVSDPDAFIYQYALVPANVDFSDYTTLIPFVTSIFLHGSILHILSNMWFLIVFGDNVNARLSPFGFLLLYFTAGIAGGLAQYMFMPDSMIPMLGASGAVAGILGCYFVLFPHSKIKTLIFVLFFVTFAEISAPIVLGFWFILQLFSSVGSLSEIASNQGGVAFFAHIAGFLVGILFGIMNKGKGEAAGIVHE